MRLPIFYLWPVHFCLLSPWRRWVKFIIKLVKIFEFGLLQTFNLFYICMQLFSLFCYSLRNVAFFLSNFVELIASCVGLDVKDITSADVDKQLNQPVRLFAYWFLCRSRDLKAQYFVGDGCTIDNRLSIVYGVLALLIAYTTSWTVCHALSRSADVRDGQTI